MIQTLSEYQPLTKKIESPSHQTKTQAKNMPYPGSLYDKGWNKPLSPFLEQRVLARFDQTLCTNNHGIKERAMCFGLSLNWIQGLKQGGEQGTPKSSIDRMSHLASFDGVVNARTTHNFYIAEHTFNLTMAEQHKAPGERLSKESLFAGSKGLVEAASVMANTNLQPKLDSGPDAQAPFMLTANFSHPIPKEDPVALSKITDAVVDNKLGVYVIYCGEGSHALGFSLQKDQLNVIVFDPNHGEFKTSVSDFSATIKELTKESGLDLMIGAQIFCQ